MQYLYFSYKNAQNYHAINATLIRSKRLANDTRIDLFNFNSVESFHNNITR